MLLRTAILALALALAPTVAFATDLMTPNDIKATFFNGQPFTASSPTGAKFKMTFTPDGKALREPLNAAAASAVSAKPAAAKPAAAKATGKKAAGAKASGAGAADTSAAGASAAGASAAGESAAANAGTPGTWRLSPAGFCTSWAGAKPSCFTLAPMSDNRWSVQRVATTISVSVAVWSKQ
jgi:DNA-binding protein HU-beta